MTLGIVLFALGIFVAILLHEAGHLLTAKAFGMKATQFFAGFGPTLWSFRRGETEYGIKAIPAGGFVKIVGMTPLEDVAPGDEGRAFYRQPAPQRLVVLVAGSATHFLLAFCTLILAATVIGLPSNRPVVGQVEDCVVPHIDVNTTSLTCPANAPAAPAATAGLQEGDRIVRFAGTQVTDQDGLLRAIRTAPTSPVQIEFVRAGHPMTTTITPASAERPDLTDRTKVVSVSAIGIGIEETEHVSFVDSFGRSGSLMGRLFGATFTAMKQFPSKLPKLWDAVAGGERDPNTPVSVVGASRLGGQALQADQVAAYFGFFAALNVFIGIFNLLPLLPLDGGHVAVLLFERARSGIARLRGRRDPGRVDIAKLMPVTYVVILLFATLSVLAVVADIVNPIANPFQQ